MGFWFFVGFGAFCGIIFIVFQICVSVRIRKKREDEYFRRMYRTMRQAQEDANKDKDKHD